MGPVTILGWTKWKILILKDCEKKKKDPSVSKNHDFKHGVLWTPRMEACSGKINLTLNCRGRENTGEVWTNTGNVIVYLKCLVLIVNLMTFKSSGRHTSEQDCWRSQDFTKAYQKV